MKKPMPQLSPAMGMISPEQLRGPGKFSFLNVVVMVGILIAGTAFALYWRMVTPTDDEKRQAAMAATKNEETQLERALESFRVDNGRYPFSEKDLADPLAANRRVVAALTDDTRYPANANHELNPGRFAYLRPDYAPIGTNGIFCDRWGKPVVIALDDKSGKAYVYSLGPDGKGTYSVTNAGGPEMIGR